MGARGHPDELQPTLGAQKGKQSSMGAPCAQDDPLMVAGRWGKAQFHTELWARTGERTAKSEAEWVIK